MRGLSVERLGVAGHVVVEHRLVERHRDRLGGLEADGGVALLGVLDARQLDHADHDLLVRDAEPDALRETGLLDEALERVGEPVAVGDLTVADEPGRQLEAGSAHDTTGVDLGGCEVAAVDIETDNAAF